MLCFVPMLNRVRGFLAQDCLLLSGEASMGPRNKNEDGLCALVRAILGPCVLGNPLAVFSTSCLCMRVRTLACSSHVSIWVPNLISVKAQRETDFSHGCVAHRVEACHLHPFPAWEEVCHCLFQGQNELCILPNDDAHG